MGTRNGEPLNFVNKRAAGTDGADCVAWHQADRFRLHGQQVKAIRQRRALGERVRTLALEFGVSPAAISMAALGMTWVAD